jgi:tetratricopeptide (TPR) repeat protein
MNVCVPVIAISFYLFLQEKAHAESKQTAGNYEPAPDTNSESLSKEEIRKQVDSLYREALSVLQQENASLKDRVNALEGAHDILVDKAKGLSAMLEEAKREGSLLQKDQDSLYRKGEDLFKENDSLRREKDALTAQLDRLKSDYDKCAEEVKTLTKKVIGQQETIYEDKDRAQRLDKELKKLQKEYDVLKIRHKELSNAYIPVEDLKKRLSEAYQQLGISYAQIKRFDLALDAYKQALAYDAKDPKTHYNLGILYQYSREDAKKCVYHLNKYLELDPSAKDKKEVSYLIRVVSDIIAEDEMYPDQ